MKSIPFFIGFVLIIPMTNVFALDRRSRVKQVNGHGVGALLYADQAILHEAIKDDLRQDAQLFWVSSSIPADPVSCRAIDIIMANTRFVSIANAWYRVVPPVLSGDYPAASILRNGQADGVAGAHYPAASILRNGQADEVAGAHYPASFPVRSGLTGEVARVPCQAGGAAAAGRAGLLVTLFGEESGILMNAGVTASPEMAIVVERYAGCQPVGVTVEHSLSMQRMSASNT